jgi:uncharacterized protein
MSTNRAGMSPRIVGLEEHYATTAFIEGPGRSLMERARVVRGHSGGPDDPALLVERLRDLGDRRIADMDAAGIDVQVLSLSSPGTEQLDPAEAEAIARDANDRAVEAVRRFPRRLAAFAALPTAAPDLAAEELERVVHTYGFKGALINGHVQGRYLDDPFFSPILERAEALGVPLYLHPTPPPGAVVETYYTGNFSPAVSAALSAAAWGWHIETAVHVLRLIVGGVFDRYPALQVVVGHLGETLPFMRPRLDAVLSPRLTHLDRPVGAYLRENLHYTVSGFNYLPAFLDLLMEVGVDRIMFSTDYPYASMERARAFLDELPVSPADKERIAHLNAARLLGLRATGDGAAI